ncbi:MAG TPA: bifunctional 2-polyprenyl-6-hydroxyphenol methylase/3-demethylubiquinol 3-O-methyltransferase UbiG [Alphaproteobacteria bacterium]
MAQAAASPEPAFDAANAPSVDPAEIARFSAMAAEWWDREGKFRPLHKLNPVRLTYIRDRLAVRFGRDPKKPRPLAGLRLLDIGCGGGLVAEPMARLGAEVVAIDASATNIGVARTHAAESELAIDYRVAAAEALAAAGERFDAVLCLEVIEHVADLPGFLAATAALVRPGGALIAATLNRTPQAFLLAIVGAEYVLGWLPRGTHEWGKFVRPAELAASLRRGGLTIEDLSGAVYSPLTDSWRLSRDLTVNYLCFAVRP